MGNCHPSKTNVNLVFALVDIGVLGVTISHVTLSCSQYIYTITFSNFVEVFEKFLRAYIEKFKQQSIDSDQWKDFLYSYFPDKVHVNVCSGIYGN